MASQREFMDGLEDKQEDLLRKVFGDARTLRGVAQYTLQLDRFLSLARSDQEIRQVALHILKQGSSMMKAALSQFLLFYEERLTKEEFQQWILQLIEENMNVTTTINILKVLQARPNLFDQKQQATLIVKLGKNPEWGVRSFLLFDNHRLEWFLTILSEKDSEELSRFLQELVNDPRIPDFTSFVPIILESQLRTVIPLDIKKKLIFRAINGNSRQHREAARRHESQIIAFLQEFMSEDEIVDFLLSCENDYLKHETSCAFICQKIVSMFQSLYEGKKSPNEVFSVLDQWQERCYLQKARPLSRERWKRYLMENLQEDHLEMLALLTEGLS